MTFNAIMFTCAWLRICAMAAASMSKHAMPVFSMMSSCSSVTEYPICEARTPVLSRSAAAVRGVGRQAPYIKDSISNLSLIFQPN